MAGEVKGTIWMNGKFVPFEEATIHALVQRLLDISRHERSVRDLRRRHILNSE